MFYILLIQNKYYLLLSINLCYFQENGSYFISSVSTLDIGLYECIAKNEIGSDMKKIDLKFYGK